MNLPCLGTYPDAPDYGSECGDRACPKHVLADLIWAGDADALYDLAPCRCCCDEHTYPCCRARLWGGCKSGLPYGEDERDEEAAWAAHYGMTVDQFLGS